MKIKLFFTFLVPRSFSASVFFLLLSFSLTYSQVPLGFNYQAVVRDAQGDIISEQDVSLKISILKGSESGTPVYVETHQETTSSFGLIILEIGNGTMISGNLPDIDWNADSYFIKIELDAAGGTNYQFMGTTKLLSVPYALNAGSVTSLKSLNIMEQTGHDTESALFEVKNQDGNTVFAVYNEGVRVYVNDDPAKGLKGGFAVGGFNSSKEITNEYLRVTPDSVRVYIDETIAKGLKGGFAVGGFSPGKAGSDNIMHLTPDNYFIGHQSGSSITTGLYNSFFGYQSGFLNDIGNRNVFLGYHTGYSNTEGNYNTFIGSNTGYSNTKGLSNVFIGDSSGYDNTIGSYNVFMGNLSGVQNNSGYYNVFIGDSAGYSNVEGNQNIFMGVGSGFSNLSGGHNVFLGVESGRNNTEGTANVFLGDYAGHLNDTGDHNIFIGASCGYNNIDGENNIFLGYASGYNNTTAGDNVFIGNYAGYHNETGTKNVFQGFQAGAYNDTGSYNVFIGNYAGRENTFGNYNTFLGTYSGRYNTEGKSNVAVGQNAGTDNETGNFNVFLGTLSGTDNTTGDQNTFVGQQAGYQNTTGNYNTEIGDLSGYSNLTGSSNVFLGHYAGYYETGSDKLYIENSSAGSTDALIYGDFDNDNLRINANVGIGYIPSSSFGLVAKGGSTNSLRVYMNTEQIYSFYVGGKAYASGGWWIPGAKDSKSNFSYYQDVLDKLITLNGVLFESEIIDKSEEDVPEGKQIGLIGEEVLTAFPELVTKDKDGNISINYAGFSTVFIEAFKEQQKLIEDLQERIAVLEGKK